MIMDRKGKRLFSLFPFGKDARGRWYVTRTDTALFMSGPPGTRSIPIAQMGAEGWRSVSSAELNTLGIRGPSQWRAGVTGEIVYDMR